MKSYFQKIFLLLAIFVVSVNSYAVEVIIPNLQLERILVQLKEKIIFEDFQSISNAINSSEILLKDLNELAVTGKFTEFSILPKSGINDGRVGIFGGFIQETKIILTTEYLKELQKKKQFEFVNTDEALSNNVVFALTHLVHHIKYPLDPRKHTSPASFMSAALDTEAIAFIQSWNSMLKAAEKDNGGKQLSTKQITQLVMNTRYRFVYLGAINQKPSPMIFSMNGVVEQNEQNILAIVNTLKNSRRADLE
jgi:hypothetical protein